MGTKDKGKIERAYELLLKLPVPILLAILWLAGAVLVGLGAVVPYSFWLLLRSVAGA